MGLMGELQYFTHYLVRHTLRGYQIFHFKFSSEVGKSFKKKKCVCTVNGKISTAEIMVRSAVLDNFRQRTRVYYITQQFETSSIIRDLD